MSNERKKTIRQWAFKIGYAKAKESLKKEHDEAFVNLKDKETMDRLEEIVQAIEYVKFLEMTNAHQLPIFK